MDPFNTSSQPTPNELLLDLQLGQLDPRSAEMLNAEIAESESLAARGRNLGGWLGLLQAYESPLPPPGLVDAVMERVESTPSLRLAAAVSSLPPAADGGVIRRPVISLRELVALAACIAFLVSVVLPSFSRMRSTSQQALCGSNLASIYQGLAQYVSSSPNGSLPQAAGFVPGANWLYPAAPGMPRMSNSRNLFLVVRLGHARPEVFICPSAGSPANTERVILEKMEDFRSSEHCGYDFQNMAGPTLPLGHGRPQPILSDHNPLFDSKRSPTPPGPDANSRSHDNGAGQNVLSSDGRVNWFITPRVPPKGDNIWQIEGVERYNGTEYQQRADDAFLVP